MSKRKGFVLWITGVSGSGKTSISKILYKKIRQKYGPTIIFQGDELRKIFNFKDFSKEGRIKNGYVYSDLIRRISDQGINVIISVIGMFEKIRQRNRKHIPNYIEIFIKCSIREVLKRTKKRHYIKKTSIVGLDINPEFPKKPKIQIVNNFKKTPKQMSDKIFSKLDKIIK